MSNVTKAQEAATLRAMAIERERGLCAACRSAPAEEMDHFWSRGRVPQRLENVWMLCRRDHRAKTDSVPSKVAWLTIWLRQVALHGYAEEVEKTHAAIQYHSTKAKLRTSLSTEET